MQEPKDRANQTPYPNNIRQRIKRQGYTLQEVADETGIARRTLTNYVSGIVPIPKRYLEKIANVIGCNVEELTINDRESKKLVQEQESTNTSPALVLATHLVNSSLWERSMQERLDNAESVINLAWEVWYASKPKQAAQALTRLLPRLEDQYRTALGTSYKLRIQELLIRCHGLLGAIFVDALENDTALYHYIHAHQLAADMRDHDQAATYLALMGDVLRRQGEKGKAISYMETARDQSGQLSRAAHGHILQLLAYTYADTGHESEFERSIREATDLLAFSGETKDTSRKEFIPFQIYEIRGKASRDLGKPLDALTYLELAEQSLKGESVTPRWHALLDISKGQAYCDTGDLTNGIELASRGFMLAYQCRSPRQMNRVRKLLKKLESSPEKGDRKVSELRELLHETYTQMDLDK